VTDEPTIPVPMTQAQRHSLSGIAHALDLSENSTIRQLVAAYDAAVARPVLRAPERLLRDALEEIAKLYSEAKRAGVIARDALAAYDAAVARAAEPERTVRWRGEP
jgi:transposase